MSRNQLVGKYMRLRAELSEIYGAQTWDSAHVNRLSSEIAAVERTLAKEQLLDERTSDALSGLISVLR